MVFYLIYTDVVRAEENDIARYSNPFIGGHFSTKMAENSRG
jgi:hypothetical protein